MHEQGLVSPPHFETGFPHGDDQVISAMGTAWATRALLRAIPERRMLPEPLVNAEDWRSDEEAPWMSTALFGSAAELERLLAGGLDPNRSTAAGTTVLMMAAGDRDKVGTLIRRNADVNLAAKTGFTPLMIAANDPEATEAIRLLIGHGASVTPSNPKPLHDGTPLFFAVSSRNVEAVQLFLARGANARAQASVGGAFTAMPIEMAVIQGDVPMVRTLVSAGIDVNAFNDAGIPPITSAVLTNRIEVAKALITLGADVNVTDELSLTPLMHAALVDYGDTEMVQLLLASGAATNPTSKDHQTALDLARQHRHDAIVRLLEQPHAGN